MKIKVFTNETEFDEYDNVYFYTNDRDILMIKKDDGTKVGNNVAVYKPDQWVRVIPQ